MSPGVTEVDTYVSWWLQRLIYMSPGVTEVNTYVSWGYRG